jgi:hypothetical protein
MGVEGLTSQPFIAARRCRLPAFSTTTRAAKTREICEAIYVDLFLSLRAIATASMVAMALQRRLTTCWRSGWDEVGGRRDGRELLRDTVCPLRRQLTTKARESHLTRRRGPSQSSSLPSLVSRSGD